MPDPDSRYQAPLAGRGSKSAACQSSSSFLWVPLSSPRDTKTCSPLPMRRSAVTTSLIPRMPAGSSTGPTRTKSLCMTGWRARPSPSATNLRSDAGWWTSSTSASPFVAMRIAWPVPTATTRTSIPVSAVNGGNRYSKSPEFCVDVVEAMVIGLGSSLAANAASATPMTNTTRRRTAPPGNSVLTVLSIGLSIIAFCSPASESC